MAESYTTVTELPGSGATREQLAMLYTRYHFAATHCAGKDVLEVACGPGIGLGYLGRSARVVVGGDYDEVMLRTARAHYQDRARVLRLDAQALPFAGQAFDVIILFEAVYYLRDPDRFFREARRVLRSKGTLLISTVNREWADFNPSPFSSRYLSATELRLLLREQGFNVQLYGAFPAQAASARDRLLSAIRRTAVRLRLIPPSMKGKQMLKRLIYGRLTQLPPEARDGMAELSSLATVPGDGASTTYKVLYALGRVP